MSPLNIPAGIVNGLFPQQAAQEPFVWGSGGRRMTPEAIARQREIAASLTRPDFSPVGSVWEGLGRAAGNWMGALRERDLDKAERKNMAYSQDQIAKLLINPGGSPSATGAPGSPQSSGSGANPAMLMQVLADPYADDGVKALAQMQLEQAQKVQMKQLEWANREQPEIVQLANIARDASQPAEVRKAASDRITALNDPMAIIPGLPNGTYVGRQSGVAAAMGGGVGGGPKVGDVVDGYRYLGGDPNSKTSWQEAGAPGVQDAPRPTSTIARSSYEAFVTQYGQEEADAILKRNGLSVGNY